MNKSWLWIGICLAAPLNAQEPILPSVTMFMGRSVEITQPNLTPDGVEPEGPAVLCLVLKDERQCYTPPRNDPPYGLEPHTSVVKLRKGDTALLFVTQASASGSGWTWFLALLQPRKAGLSNLLPNVSISNQAEYQFWSESTVSHTLVFAKADYVWRKGETHFSRHYYEISTYLYDANSRRYRLRDRYLTRRRYPGLDETDKIDVLSHEKAKVIARLKEKPQTVGTLKGQIVISSCLAFSLEPAFSAQAFWRQVSLPELSLWQELAFSAEERLSACQSPSLPE